MLRNTLICVFATAALVLSAAAGVSSGSVHGSWWSMLPPLVAIFLALVTKEVYSSLFVGIVVGGMLASGCSFEGPLVKVTKEGFIASIADPYNIGILLFLVMLGALVSLMGKTGASAAFGR